MDDSPQISSLWWAIYCQNVLWLNTHENYFLWPYIFTLHLWVLYGWVHLGLILYIQCSINLFILFLEGTFSIMFNNFECMFKVSLFSWLMHKILNNHNTSQSRFSHLVLFAVAWLVLQRDVHHSVQN